MIVVQTRGRITIVVARIRQGAILSSYDLGARDVSFDNVRLETFYQIAKRLLRRFIFALYAKFITTAEYSRPEQIFDYPKIHVIHSTHFS